MANQPQSLSGTLLYEKIESLNQVKVDSSTWQVFYLDPLTGEKWVKEYPQSELHGGGPPILFSIDKFPWE